MRRARTEWLILPLMLLPLLGGAAFLAYAWQRHEAERRAMARMPEISTTPPLIARFRHEMGVEPDASEVRARWPELERTLRVRLPMGGSGPREWIFASGFPGGAGPGALADAGSRLALESGTAAVALEGADPASLEFSGLLDDPDLTRLARASLPVESKRYLVARWRARGLGGSEGIEGREAAGMLLRHAKPFDPRPAGLYPLGECMLVSLGRDRDAILEVPGPGSSVRKSFRFSETAGDFERGVVTGPAEPPAAGLLWAGRREKPPDRDSIAGTYFVVDRTLGRWWRTRFFSKWAGPVALALAAALVFPVWLWIALRRQRAIDDARVRFLTEIAHDLRTPLTAVRLHAEMLAEGRAPEAKRHYYVETVARESGRLSGLLANLVDFTRLERGERGFLSEPLLVAEAAETAVRDFQLLYPGRRDDVSLDGPPDARVRADRTALARCLANLLDNAGKFTAAGTPITVRWNGAGRIEVADEGPGIADRDAGALFDRYRRGAEAQANGVPGTGLGLSLVRELARGMGGDAELAESERGARFVIRLPGVVA